MAIVSVRIPQIGEGLQEARLVATLKQPGDTVRRDEPIYQMETDKAVMDVESPYAGTLTEWLAPVDAVLPIGGEVARMEVSDEVQEIGVGHDQPSSTPVHETSAANPASGRSLQGIPPRTRAYAKEKGVSDEQLAELLLRKPKPLPSDIDELLSGETTRDASRSFQEVAVSPKQRLLASRLVRGSQLVVPGTMSMALEWSSIEAERSRIKASGSDFQPSAFTMFAFAVAKATVDFPLFRSTLVGEDTMRTYDSLSLGIAVSLPADELVLAVVDRADRLTWREFAESVREKIELARSGKDQANESVTLSLTNMQSFGIRDAVPVVVPPSVATLFLGEVYVANDHRLANIALTFDHRIMNGVGAAQFMARIRDLVATIGESLD